MEKLTPHHASSPENSLEKGLFAKNLFLKNTKELKEYLKNVQVYLRGHTETELRKSQLDNYHNLIKNVLHLDPQDDPYRDITGKSLEELYMRQSDISQNLEYVKMINAARTLLVSGDILLDENISHEFFDPLILVPEKDWIIQFGFINSFHQNIFFGQGSILLEPEIVHNLEMYDPQGRVVSHLGDVMNWFNHDLTAHGVFIPADYTLDADITKNNHTLLPFFQKAYTGEHVESFKSAVVGEMWSLNLHENLFQKIVEKRPAVIRFLSQHIHEYIREVELLTVRHPDPIQGNYIKEYLIKAYTFPFFRLMNPQELRTQSAFQDIFEKYPDIDHHGNEENHVREYVYGTSGIQNPQDPTEFISHRDYIDRILEQQSPTLERRSEYLEIKKQYSEIMNGLFSQEDMLQKDKMELFYRYFSEESTSFIINSLDTFFECNHKEGETFSFLINKNKKEVVRFLVDHSGEKDTFMDRLYKHLYGFTAHEIKQNHFRKEKNIIENTYED